MTTSDNTPTPAGIPAWALPELFEALEALPPEENATARAILANNEHTVEHQVLDGVPALAIDAGPLELLTCEPDAPSSGQN